MARRQGRHTPPFSLRLTQDERERLNADAGDWPVGAYVRSRLFDAPSPRKRSSRRLDADRRIMLQILSELGKQHVSSSLNQTLKSIQDGEMEVTPELVGMLKKTRADLRDIKRLLKNALSGITPEGDGDAP